MGRPQERERQRRRAAWQTRINAAGGWPCQADRHHPTCPGTIPPHRSDLWHLGHTHPYALGNPDPNGDRPEWAACNDCDASRIAVQAQQRRDYPLPASRKW